MNRITKSSAIGYAVDVTLEALWEDLGDLEAYPLGSDLRAETVDLFRAIVRHAPRRNRRYWEEEMNRPPHGGW